MTDTATSDTLPQGVLCKIPNPFPPGHKEHTFFHIRIVRRGEGYGLNKQVIHNDRDPLVEFYDAEYAGRSNFDPEGQFVSRYYVSTLLNFRPGEGIGLHGNSTCWSVDHQPMAGLRNKLREMFPEYAKDYCPEPIETLEGRGIFKQVKVPGGGGGAPGRIVIALARSGEFAVWFYNEQDKAFYHGSYCRIYGEALDYFERKCKTYHVSPDL